MKRDSFTKVFKQGKKQTETTNYYRDGKLHATMVITRMREDWKPLLSTKYVCNSKLSK